MTDAPLYDTELPSISDRDAKEKIDRLTDIIKLRTAFEEELFNVYVGRGSVAVCDQLQQQLEIGIEKLTNIPVVLKTNRQRPGTTFGATHPTIAKIAEVMRFVIEDEIRVDEVPGFQHLRQPEGEYREPGMLDIDEVLGSYFPEDQRIVLYVDAIKDYAGQKIKVSSDIITEVVLRHEAAHAVIHLGKDADGNIFKLHDYLRLDGREKPGRLHETLAQLFCFHSVNEDAELSDCLHVLCKYAPAPYVLWDDFRNVSLERIRDILIDIRRNRLHGDYETFARNAL